MKVIIKKSTNAKKKYMAIFYDGEKKVKTTHFGAKNFSHFPIHKDEERKKRYLDRHRKNENWNDKFSAGSLSRWVLWNKPSIKASIADYKKRFNLK